MAEMHETISEDDKRELQDAFLSCGIEMFKEFIKKKNDEWKQIPLNIAVSGVSGVGKSSLINAFRGISADDDGGAQIGSTETTMDITPYAHPDHSSFVLWDLPGVGTPTFPREKYLEKVVFEKYDFFLILSVLRFRDDDLWLAKEIRSLGKNFHFVRTHMNDAVVNNQRGCPKTHSKAKVIDEIRENCQKNLKDNGLTRASVFLIDSYCRRDYDFDLLSKTLIDEAPGHKREAMILSMSVLTDGVLRRKVEALRRRIYKVSLLSALGGAIPVPGLGAVIDSSLLLEEVNFYKSQLGLDAETINERARYLDTDAEQLQVRLSLENIRWASTAKGLAEIMSGVVASETIESTLPIAIPIMGSFIAAGISYGVTLGSLRYILRKLSDDAQKINKEMMKKSLESSENL